ncbi:MAG: cytidylate kinase-like family protein [Deltaproteobacteria bacterium]|nr:cytidylate kinase-like family protein [Deltaproteobacteria bacterium]
MAVITISRQFGAGGITLGKMITDKLGYTFADNEIVQMIARGANVSTAWARAVDREAGNLKLRFISRRVSQYWINRVIEHGRGYLDDRIYLDYLVLIIAQLADEGDAVILGRGSQYILQDHPDAYHLLLLDEFENRVRFMMKHYDMDQDRATEVVIHEDKRRANLYRMLGKKDYDQPSLYHAVLNMGRIDLDTALNFILRMIQKPPKK